MYAIAVLMKECKMAEGERERHQSTISTWVSVWLGKKAIGLILITSGFVLLNGKRGEINGDKAGNW